MQNVPPDLPAYPLLALYRIALELANNTVKHAQTTKAQLLSWTESQPIALRAEANGISFDQAQAIQRKGVGWQTLQDQMHWPQSTLLLQQQSAQVISALPLPLH